MPGASRLLRRPAAVVMLFGEISVAGVFVDETAGVDVRRRPVANVEDGAADAIECREDGRRLIGGGDSAFGAMDVRRALCGSSTLRTSTLW